LRYSQPFGTPAPPLGTYPRYVNGNPVTGTEGSIPPATAFDEAQVEIVTVISNAGLVPDHADLTQLWQALMELFAQRYITTEIVKSVHGVGADFVDLHEALNWLGKYIITPTGFVTFMIAAGKWTYIKTVEINHPNANRVAIQGSALLGATPQPPNLSVTGYGTSTDGTNQIIYLRSVHASELSFTGGVSGFRFYRDGITLRYLLITGSQTIAATGRYDEGCGFVVQSQFYSDGNSIWGFGSDGILVAAGGLFTSITSLSTVVSWCNVGIDCLTARFVVPNTQHVIVTSNRNGGIAINGTYANMGLLYLAGTHVAASSTGALGVGNGATWLCASGSEIKMNDDNGIKIQGLCTLAAASITIRQNTKWAVEAQSGYGQFYNCTFTANTLGSVNANSNAFVDTIGTALSSGSSGVSSPALNTVGNGQAYVQH
jgi:hypothetical protein